MTGRRYRRTGTASLLRVAGLALALSLGAGPPAVAGPQNAGTTAANFLALGAGTRALGMAGAVLGLGDDLGAGAWNAAAVGWLVGTQVALAHAGLPDRSLQEWGSLGGRAGRSQIRWSISGLYRGDRSLDGRDASGAPTGSFSASSMALAVTLARPVGDRLSLGLAAKAVSERLATVTGSGVTCDAGIQVRAGGFGLGLAAQNLGGRMAYGGSRYRFPTSYGAGLGYTHAGTGLRLACDLNVPDAYHPDLRGGIEWTFREALALRAGYRRELGSEADPLTGPSFGVSGRQGGMWVDYGYLLNGNAPGQHRLGMRFGPA